MKLPHILATPAHGVYALGVPHCTPLKLPLCTPVIGVQPQSTLQKCLEFWSDALHGVPIQMPCRTSMGHIAYQNGTSGFFFLFCIGSGSRKLLSRPITAISQKLPMSSSQSVHSQSRECLRRMRLFLSLSPTWELNVRSCRSKCARARPLE